MKLALVSLLLFFSWYTLKSQLPDFKCGISFNYGYNKPSKTVNLNWDFFNVGGSANTTFTIAYLASTDMIIDASDYLIDYKFYGSAVANAFSTVTFSYAFSEGDLPNGVYNLIVYLDYGNNVIEQNENNNIVSFGTFDFISTNTAIKELSNENFRVEIFPNPTNDYLLLSAKKEIRNASITDIDGKSLLTQYATEGDNIKIPVQNLEKGLYILFIYYSDGSTGKEKFFKY